VRSTAVAALSARCPELPRVADAAIDGPSVPPAALRIKRLGGP
jgi:hypothetical protein